MSINPATPVETLSCILEDVDLVLIMSVNPGFGGQKFIPQTVSKVRELAKIKKERGLSFAIEIDGGVTLDKAKMLAEAVWKSQLQALRYSKRKMWKIQ